MIKNITFCLYIMFPLCLLVASALCRLSLLTSWRFACQAAHDICQRHCFFNKQISFRNLFSDNIVHRTPPQKILNIKESMILLANMSQNIRIVNACLVAAITTNKDYNYGNFLTMLTSYVVKLLSMFHQNKFHNFEGISNIQKLFLSF